MITQYVLPDPKPDLDPMDAFEAEMEAEFGAFLDDEVEDREQALAGESEQARDSQGSEDEELERELKRDTSLSDQAAELLADLARVDTGLRSLGRSKTGVAEDAPLTPDQLGLLGVEARAGGVVAVTQGGKKDPPLTPIALGALGAGALAGAALPIAYAVPVVGFGAALLIAANERDASSRPSVRERVLKGELTLEPADRGYRDGGRRYFAKLDGQPLGVEGVRRVSLRTLVPKDPGSPRWQALVLELEHHSVELARVPQARSELGQVAQELSQLLRVEVGEDIMRAEVDTTGAVGLSVVGVGTGVIAGAVLGAVLPPALAAVSVAVGAVAGGLTARAIYRRALSRYAADRALETD